MTFVLNTKWPEVSVETFKLALARWDYHRLTLVDGSHYFIGRFENSDFRHSGWGYFGDHDEKNNKFYLDPEFLEAILPKTPPQTPSPSR